MSQPKAVIFDLDETLAPSFQSPAPSLIAKLEQLIAHVPVAIMSGAGFERIEKDVVKHMIKPSENFYLFPNSSAQCFFYRNESWEQKYSHLLTPEERAEIKAALTRALAEIPSLQDAPALGMQIADREAQIAFTPVGLDAPQDIKMAWDPTAEKRLEAARILKDWLPAYNILIGGAATIDFTRKDVNKAYGVRWFADYLQTTPEQLLYIGDALYPGGNDEVVIITGVRTMITSGPAETEQLVDHLLESFQA